MKRVWSRWARVSSMAFLVVSLLTLPSCGPGIEETFPVWWEAGAEDSLGSSPRGDDQVHPAAELRFDGIEFAEDESGQDTLHITLENTGDTDIGFCEDEYRVDYLHKGAWYTVYFPSYSYLFSGQLEPGGSYSLRFKVDPGVFEHKGAFRFYLDDVGYCLFDNA